MEGEQKPLYAHPLPVMCPFPISLTSHSPLVALHIPGHSLAAGAELLGQLFLPPQVQPEERQQRSALSKAPSPGHGPGHTQLTGQEFGGICSHPTAQCLWNTHPANRGFARYLLRPEGFLNIS